MQQNLNSSQKVSELSTKANDRKTKRMKPKTVHSQTKRLEQRRLGGTISDVDHKSENFFCSESSQSNFI